MQSIKDMCEPTGTEQKSQLVVLTAYCLHFGLYRYILPTYHKKKEIEGEKERNQTTNSQPLRSSTLL